MEYVEGIREAGERAAKIVSDLLAFSRKSSSEMLPVNIEIIIDSALDLAAKDYSLMHHFDFRDIKIVREMEKRYTFDLLRSIAGSASRFKFVYQRCTGFS